VGLGRDDQGRACSKSRLTRQEGGAAAPLTIKGDRTIAQLSDQFGIHVSQITAWKEQLQASAADVFGAGAGATPSTPPVDIKALHAKIGELTLENDFLEGALSKAGLLTARR